MTTSWFISTIFLSLPGLLFRQGAGTTASFCFSAVLVGLFLSADPLVAQQDSAAIDSVYVLPSVTVTAQSLLPKIARAARPTAVIDKESITASGANDLADAVAYAPGVFVKRYGGLGGLRTVSLRGTAAEQTVLYIDGMRYRSSAESGFDFGNIPAEGLAEVEVVRGGDALLFGANSIGGAINIVTGGIVPETLTMKGSIAAGSFGEQRVGVSGTYGSDGHTFEGNLSQTRSDGDYPFVFNEFGEEREIGRENGDFSNLFGRLSWGYRNPVGWNFGASVQGYSTDRGVPGAVVQGNREQLQARLDEQDLFATARAEKNIGQWNLSLAASGRTNSLHYRDPDARLNGPAGVDNLYERLDGAILAKVFWFPDDATLLTGTLESDHARLEGDNLDPSVGDVVSRTRYGGGVRGTHRFEEGPLGKELSLDGGVRFDLFSDIDPQIAPSFGLVWRPYQEPLRLRAHVALNYRAPGFNEQYYLNFGNTDLQAENSRSISLGGTWEATDRLVLEAGLFLIDTRNRIVAIPRSPVSWSAQNIGKVRSRGMELGAVGSFFRESLDLRVSYTLMEARDRTDGITRDQLLPYAPQELFNGILAFRQWGMVFSGSWEYVSHRHTLAWNTPESALPHYKLVHAGIAKSQTFGPVELSARINLQNIFNSAYQVVRNYPMPGRSLRVEISGSWSRK